MMYCARHASPVRGRVQAWYDLNRLSNRPEMATEPFVVLQALQLIARPFEALHFAIRVQAWRCIGLRRSLPGLTHNCRSSHQCDLHPATSGVSFLNALAKSHDDGDKWHPVGAARKQAYNREIWRKT